MSRPWLASVLCLVAFLALAGRAGADVTLSESNAPASVLDAQISSLLASENAALGRLDGKRLVRLGKRLRWPFSASRKAELSYSREFLAGLPPADGDAQWECLSEALYFEARGESVRGQFAVAEVILNRVDSPDFPDTVCAVVNQGTGRLFRCQFTYTCDGRREFIDDRAAWIEVGKVARLMLDGHPRGLTGGATYYHTRAVRPRWSRKFTRTAAIGAHYFYRPALRTAARH